MNNLDINENDDKLNLIKQIYKYNEKGYELYRHYSISDDINELKFQLAILQDNKRKFHIEKELKYYELIFKIKSGLSGEQIHQKEELLKFCFGSNEYYEYLKQQLKSSF